MKKRIFLIINLILIITIIFLEYKYTTELTSFDISISESIYKIHNPILTTFMKIITFMASTKFLIVLLLLYSIVKKDIFFALNMGISTILNNLLKIVFKRPRPTGMIVMEKGYSFPSGHSMSAVSFYGYIIYKLYRSNKDKWIKVLLISLLVLLIGLIGFSRIYLGVHYFSDVITGFLISLEYIIIFITIEEKVTKK